MGIRFTQPGTRRFLSRKISVGSVATHLRCGGEYFIIVLPEIIAKSLPVKEFENRFAFGKDKIKK